MVYPRNRYLVEFRDRVCVRVIAYTMLKLQPVSKKNGTFREQFFDILVADTLEEIRIYAPNSFRDLHQKQVHLNGR